MGAQPLRMMVVMASDFFTRSAGVGGAQQGFEIREAERAKINSIAQGNSAGQP